MKNITVSRITLISLLTGFLLNLTGWLGNNFILGNLWQEVNISVMDSTWRNSIWRDIFSFITDFVYGFAIVWLIVLLNAHSGKKISNSIKAGLCVSLVGGITTYFAIANSGFISWKLAMASFLLIIVTNVAFAILAGKLLYK